MININYFLLHQISILKMKLLNLN